MSEPTSNKSKVTLENLLRLKRHERPPAEYWARFDRELNERVWRSLTQPAQSRNGEFLGWLGHQARWLTVGAVSTLALALAWVGNSPTPLKPLAKAQAAPTVQIASTSAPTLPAVDPAPNNNAQALAAAAENNLPVVIQPVLVAAKVLDSTNPAGFNKVPAMLAFATSEGAGVSYATDTLNSPAYSARIRGSAY